MKKQGNILVVDDNRNILASVRILLSNVFNNVVTLASPANMLSAIRENRINVVLLDMNFASGINNGNEGFFWLQEINRHFPEVPVVLFTAYADIQLAVRAIKQGAFDFVEKPWDNRKLTEVLINAYRSQNRKDTTPKAAEESMFWGTTPAMCRLHEMVEKVALTDANVLITGENGTGKDLLARELHKLSRRRNAQMVCVDMGAIAESLFESELFGHVKGSFTDARADRTGYIEEANGGTLFLDEIGNLPLHQQAKLLNALQRRCVTRVGSSRSTTVDIRLICATNKNLYEMVCNKLFREDLFYRINTVHLELPPLRERKEDIRPLAEQFAAFFAKKYDKPALTLSDSAVHALESCYWRGNIRELHHVMEKAVIFASGKQIDKSDLHIHDIEMQAGQDAETIEDMEKSLICKTLEKSGGNLSLTASKLGITRQTLYNKLKRYGIDSI